MCNKIKWSTFKYITGNIPKDDIAQNENDVIDFFLKERHQGLAIKILPNTKKNDNNNFSADIDDDSLDSPTEEVETLISGNKTDETNDREVIINNSKKYGYTCITLFLDNSAIISKQMQLLNLEQKQKLEEERKNRIVSLITNNNISIFKIKRENFKLYAELKIIHEELVDNTNMIDGGTRINKEWREAEIIDKITENEKNLQALIQKDKKLSEYITFNKNYRNSLQYRIFNLNNEIKAKDIETKLQKKEKEVTDLVIRIEATTSRNQRRKLMKKKLKLCKELKILKQENDQKVTKIYEEIVLQKNYLYFVTTLVHNDESMTEEVIYFENDKNGEPIVWTQIKKYKNVSEYEKDALLIAEISDDNVNTFSKIPIKIFLSNLEEAKNKISKLEWILFISITLISITLLAIMPVIAPFISAILFEKAVVAVLSIAIAWIVNKGIIALVADKTKKVEALMKKKVFSWMRKIFKSRSIGKTKEELEIKNNVDKLTENLKSEKLETRLSTQFSILKDLLNVRKDRKPNELIVKKEILTVKNEIIPIANKSFDANKINNLDSQPSINTKQQHYVM